jgi:hypothetical protein
MILAFERGFIADLPGNRNDNNHRAALKFLELCETEPAFADLDIAGQQRVLNERIASSSTTGNGASISPEQIEHWLTERKAIYMQSTPEIAFRIAKRELGTLGGRMLFNAIFRKVMGNTIDLKDNEQRAAELALSSMSFINDPARNTSPEEVTLRGVQAFVNALRRIAPSASFGAADVCRWAPEYYTALSTALPEDFKQPNRLAYIIKNNADLLGLQGDLKGFSIKSADNSGSP